MKVWLAQLNPIVGDLEGNTCKIIEAIDQARLNQAELVLFSELVLCGYPPEDLLLLPDFIQKIQEKLRLIIQATQGIIAIVGTPSVNHSQKEKHLYNSAAVIQNQVLLGYQHKSLLPTYDVFYERRYFEPASEWRLWKLNQYQVAITICEDIWESSRLLEETSYHQDPLQELSALKPDLLLNLSASPYSLHKSKNRIKVCQTAALKLNCPVIFCNQVGGNDSLIFEGGSLFVSSQGEVLRQEKKFSEDQCLIDTTQKTAPRVPTEEDPIEDLYQALVLGLKDYFIKSGFQKACLGLSGGIDSALVACLAADALGPSNVLGISMPSRFNPDSSFQDAKILAQNLQIDFKEIPIEKPFQSYLELLEPHFEGRPFNVAEENLQSRVRGMILMAMSNKYGYLVLSTGNKSEMAMGYTTLYGDSCGGLAVISDVTKGQVYQLARWINRKKEIIPSNSIEKPPSAELRPNQKDQDTLPPYEIIDHVLQAYVEEHMSLSEIADRYHYPLALIEDIVKKIHLNEYKRRQSPLGLRVSEKAFSAGRRFPIVERWILK